MKRNLLALLGIGLLLAGCSVYIPPSSPYTALAVPTAAVAEDLLLDLAIPLFSFEQPTLKSGRPDLQLNAIRSAEARYMPVMLQHTLRQTGIWGAIYVLPEAGVGHDVLVEARIVEASAHTLELDVSVSDAAGALWFKRIYTEHVANNVYGDDSIGVDDPFQGIYNRIANDLASHARTQLTQGDIATIRQVAELKFGNAFAPQRYGLYLRAGAETTTVLRMPPANDPGVLHLREIRQRDHAFQAVLQDHYVDFAQRVADSYYEYRRQSFRELQDLQARQRNARGDIVGGALWLGAAAALGNIDGALGVASSAGAAVVGAAKIARGVRAYPDRSFFLDEIAESFATEALTHRVELDEDVVILSGSVDEVYAQWKGILRSLFAEEGALQP